jgi:hypothetical protein
MRRYAPRPDAALRGASDEQLVIATRSPGHAPSATFPNMRVQANTAL